LKFIRYNLGLFSNDGNVAMKNAAVAGKGFDAAIDES